VFFEKWFISGANVETCCLLVREQIKDKLGLEKRMNYNVGSGEGRVPKIAHRRRKKLLFKLIDKWNSMRKKTQDDPI